MHNYATKPALQKKRRKSLKNTPSKHVWKSTKQHSYLFQSLTVPLLILLHPKFESSAINKTYTALAPSSRVCYGLMVWNKFSVLQYRYDPNLNIFNFFLRYFSL